ncbi:hypothetical protein LIER_39804 [Lithospermum erythrorhizon]|uniref:Uncharacterized protein n=1 Tax=Lithospermum erythrorhizon TaxID=34254 RepID=A0AAV3QPJ9_LITER
MANLTLHAENSAKTQSEVEKLRDGFSEALPHEVFCDRDVLIKAGLTKGADNFLKFTLLALLSRKHASRKALCLIRWPTSPSLRKSKRAPKVKVSEAAPFVFEVVVEAFEPPSPTTRDPITIVIPDGVSPSLGKMPVPSSPPSSALLPTEYASGSGGPWLPTPYTLPSGVTVTEETVSKMKSSTSSLLMKKCMLRKDVEGILTCASPDELHDTFSHFQLRATECAYGLSLKWRVSRRFPGQTDIASLKRSLEESQQASQGLRTRLNSSQQLLADTEKRLEELSLRPSPEAVVSIMKEFNSEVYMEFCGIHSLFPEFVEKTFGKGYVVEMNDSEDEDSESHGSGDDGAFAKDAPPEDAPVV